MKNIIIHSTLILIIGMLSCTESSEPEENRETNPYLERFKKVNDSTEIKMVFKNGLLIDSSMYVNELREGICFHASSETGGYQYVAYENGEKNGETISFYSNDSIQSVGAYYRGNYQGDWLDYAENGQIIKYGYRNPKELFSASYINGEIDNIKGNPVLYSFLEILDKENMDRASFYVAIPPNMEFEISIRINNESLDTIISHKYWFGLENNYFSLQIPSMNKKNASYSYEWNLKDEKGSKEYSGEGECKLAEAPPTL